MKKQWIVVILTAGSLIYEFYWVIKISLLAHKEELIQWPVLLNEAMFLMMLAGMILYVVSKWRHLLLLRAALFYAVFFPFFQFLLVLAYLFSKPRGSNALNDQLADALLQTHLRHLPVLIAEYCCLILLNGSRQAVATDAVRSVSRWMRLLIHVIDVGFVFLIFSMESWLLQWLWRDDLPSTYSYFLLAAKWVFAGQLFLYFLLFEGFAGLSLGKVLTNTIIVDEMGQHAGFWPRVSRSFARLLPFDSLSFLFGKRGWHDSLSDTYVTKIRKTGGDGLAPRSEYP